VTTATTESAVDAPRPRRSTLGVIGVGGVLLLLTTAGALIVYKTAGALKVLGKAEAEGTLAPKARWIETADLPAAVRPLVDSLNYLSWVMIALAFGVVIGAMVRAFIPSRWLQRTVAAEGVRGQILAALAGAPLMLCSCCVAPVFEGVYDRTRRLGPALGLMLAAPALNPAVLVVTFLLFPGDMAWARLVASLAMVLLGAALLGRVFPDPRPPEACPIESEAPSWRRLARNFGSSLRTVAWRSLPAIVLGVVISAAITGLVPLDWLSSDGGGGAVLLIVAVALVAIPLALPTFGEIPLALALLAAGAPPGAAVALLIAGPAINLPSLLTLGRATSWKVATATAGAVFAAAVVAGLLV
jgi:uncharacterized membrane protein YraQ (UPF0718 family)